VLYLAVADSSQIDMKFEIVNPELEKYEDLEDTYIEGYEDFDINYVSVDTLFGESFKGRIYALFIPVIKSGESTTLLFRMNSMDDFGMKFWMEDYSFLLEEEEENSPIQRVINTNALTRAFGCAKEMGGCLYSVVEEIAQSDPIAKEMFSTLGDISCVWGFGKAQVEAVVENYQNMYSMSVSQQFGNWFVKSADALVECGNLPKKLKKITAAYSIAKKVYSLARGELTLDYNPKEGWKKIGYDCIKGIGSGCFGKDVSIGSLVIGAVNSFDPNEMVGPTGFSENNYIRRQDQFTYTMFFENDAEKATAPAQEVFLTDTLDLTLFNPEEFSFKTFTFRDITVEATPGVSEFSKDIDMREYGENSIIRISSTFDKETGIINWHFITLDPETMDFTEDPELGVIFPNTAPPIGEGNVSYTIGIRPEVGNGAVIKNRGNIVFDLNAPILTNVYVNIFDEDLPTSSINHQPYVVYNSSAVISWAGTDPGSGVGEYYIYVREDSEEEFSLWLSTTETSVVFKGEHGKVYHFFSIAVDNVGNREEMKTQAELTITINTSLLEETAKNEVDIYPNPVQGLLSIKSQEVINHCKISSLAGSVLYESYPEEYTVEINMETFASGVYIIEIGTEREILNTKLIKK
ncbi:T9SS type A sorting domain-containing protein, partial [Bacteroidales bacterium OttesenSCG-928-L03]|nr:T9SS type A sorting domain-containing protein [Bacteroidales bacterium OttesenSCG-928-L03]